MEKPPQIPRYKGGANRPFRDGGVVSLEERREKGRTSRYKSGYKRQSHDEPNAVLIATYAKHIAEAIADMVDQRLRGRKKQR
jgi:hypothetical protein